MPEDQQGQEPAPEPITKGDFEQFRQQLGQFIGGVAGKLNSLEQQVAARGMPSAPAPAPLPDDIDQKLVQQFLNEPRRFAAELVTVAEERAAKRIEARLAQEREQQGLTQAHNYFFQSFYQDPQNAPLAPFHAQIEASLLQMGVDVADHLRRKDTVTLSRATDAAAEQLRALLAQREQQALQAQARQQAGARRAAGAPGSALPPAAADGAQPNPDRIHPRDALVEAMSEFEQQRAKRMWNNIDTPEYRAAAKDRAARVVLKKSA